MCGSIFFARRSMGKCDSPSWSIEKLKSRPLSLCGCFFLFGFLLLLFLRPSLTFSQEVGGTASAGMEWDNRFRVGGWYNYNFGAVTFDGDDDGVDEVWLFGGQYSGDVTNQIVCGPQGNNWKRGRGETAEFAPWSSRSDFEAVVYQDLIWVFAGKETPSSDVWYSANGWDWNQAPDAPWPTRGGYEADVFNGKIWLMGGFDGQNFLNDVWSFDGTTWQQEANAPWQGRNGFAAEVLNGELFIYGGMGNDGSQNVVLADAWKTSDGVNWVQTTPEMEIGPIREHASVVFDNRMWIIGGTISTNDLLYDPYERVSLTDEVWYSYDGVTWYVAAEYGFAPMARLQGMEAVVISEYRQQPSEPIVHERYQEFPRLLVTGGKAANVFANGYVFVDRRDHELIRYPSPNSSAVAIKSPTGRQDSRTTTSSITVDQEIVISDVNLKFTMEHDNWPDITMKLWHDFVDKDGMSRSRPLGIIFSSPPGQGLVDSVFTDEGGQPWGAIQFPYLEPDPLIRWYALIPGDGLKWFDGITSKGTWRLEIVDSGKGNDGMLWEWSLEFRGIPVPPSPGVTVSPVIGLQTSESGGSDSFTVVLDTQPADDVHIAVSSSNEAEGTVDPVVLLFTPEDYDTPQTVTVTGVDDTAEDGDITYSIVLSAAISNDPDYDNFDPDDVNVVNKDDDSSSGGNGNGKGGGPKK